MPCVVKQIFEGFFPHLINLIHLFKEKDTTFVTFSL